MRWPKSAGDAAGISDLDEVRRLPMSLIGTPDEIKRELRSRIEEFNITYHFMAIGSPDAVEPVRHQGDARVRVRSTKLKSPGEIFCSLAHNPP